MRSKLLKKVVLFLIVTNILFISNVKASDLFLDISVWGLCKVAKVCNAREKIVWRNNFLTPELLRCAKNEDLGEIVEYSNSIKHKRIKKPALKVRLKRYVILFNRSKKRFSKPKYNSLILYIALKGM